MPEQRLEACSICYKVQLALRENRSWEGQIPATLDGNIGWLKSQPYAKRTRRKMLEEAFTVWVEAQKPKISSEEIMKIKNELTAGNLKADEYPSFPFLKAAEEKFHSWIENKARNILEEVTFGTLYPGQDSPIPCDMRFKRTREGNIYIGAGNLSAAMKEAAWRLTDNVGMKRRLKTRLWFTPGKVVIHRPIQENGRFRFQPIRIPDGRHERHVPPEPPSPRNFFRGKPATIVYAEKVNHPACLQFFLWTTPEINDADLRIWLKIAGQHGLMGYRSMRQGQFNLIDLRLAPDDVKQKLLQKEAEKASAEAMALVESDGY